MHPTLRTVLQYLFFLGLGLFFVWLTIKDINQQQWTAIKYAVANARHWVAVPVVAMLLISHYSRAMRWKILMEPLGYKPSNFNTFAAVMIGYLVNAGVPRLGEVVKCTLLARYEKVRADKLVGTIVVERAVDVVCLLIIFVLALLFEGHLIGDYVANLFANFFRNRSGDFSFTKIGIVLVIVIGGIALASFVLRRFGHIDAVGKIKNILTGIANGLNSIRLVKRKGLFLFHTVLIWAMYLASTTVGIYALRETAHLGIGSGLTTLGIGSIAMIITPGGIGAYPFLVEKLMELYGVARETGIALGWLLWVAQTVIIILGGLLCFALLTFFNKRETLAQPENIEQ
ncbi:lysylphosphatidylglycerol synthase transmembrane domain-containing protein [Pseudocnuella soli]|uniref:lysylphosphatidylglycerol synthase transmembrane domain-containing protein n=1 Tax=Pseudocnuella soli TaxID=2502779 RepID=UPI001046C9F2|nr:lysylphosphatidylglycerol synthase transmembrane domain-containing protein [Pseudocnuella soli]